MPRTPRSRSLETPNPLIASQRWHHEQVLTVIGVLMFSIIVLAATLFLRTGLLAGSVLSLQLGQPYSAQLTTGEELTGIVQGLAGDFIELRDAESGKTIYLNQNQIIKLTAE